MALDVGIGLSTEVDPAVAVKEAARQAIKNIRYKKFSLAIVFSSLGFASSAVLKALSAQLENVPLIGCSGTPIISSQGIFKHGIIVMLLGHHEDISYSTALVNTITKASPLVAAQELGQKLLADSATMRRVLSVVFFDGLLKENSNFIDGLQQRLGTRFPLLGASASDDLHFSKTYVYYNKEAASDAACGLLLGGKINFGLGIKHGWRPLGKPRVVTKSEDNIVYAIDGKAAAMMYEDCLGLDTASLRKELRYLSVFYPVGIHLAMENEFLLRNVLSIEDNGALVFQGNIAEGSEIRLMIGTKESALEATEQACLEAKRDIGTNIDFLFVFNSISRYILFKREAYKELEVIKNTIGRDIPIIGFYTYGDQAPLKTGTYQSKIYFHNHTIAVLAIGKQQEAAPQT